MLQALLPITFQGLAFLTALNASALLHRFPVFTWSSGTVLTCAVITLLCSLWLLGHPQAGPRALSVLTTLTVVLFAHVLVLVGVLLSFFPGHPQPGRWALITLSVLATTSLIGQVTLSHRHALSTRQHLRRAREQDALTGLLNRAGLLRAAALRLDRTDVTVVVLDVNSLKLVNDTGGHEAGDALLRNLADALRAELPVGSAAGRWGGDEFLLLLPGHGDVAALMTRLHARVPHPRGRSRAFTSGAALAPAGSALPLALALADEAMYEQKARLELQDGVDSISYAQLQDFTQRLVKLQDTSSLQDQGFRRCLQVTGFEGLIYFRLQEDFEVIEPLAWQYVEGLPVPDLHGRRFPASALTIEAARTQQTRWDVNFGRRGDITPLARQEGVRSMLIAPVLLGDLSVGVLCLTTYSKWQAISPQNRLILEALALHLGQALERERTIEHLHASLESSVRELGLVLEVRDLETSGHTDRVTGLAARFAAALTLSGEQKEHLRLGAYLHDVGKLGIPDRVLLKPGQLDVQERALIETHTLMGAELTRRMPSLPPEVTGVVLSHHERWDGTGYPQGLAGEEIPLLARVFAICDVYDALTSVRPYKRAWTHEAAITELRAQAGRQFDPRLVEVFVTQCWEEPADQFTG